MPIDLTTILINSKWQTEQIGYHCTVVGTPDANGLTRWWELKGKLADGSGWPGDVNQFDDKWIYFYVTEDDPPNRNDPRSYKIQTGVPGKGMIVLPRYAPSLPAMCLMNRMGVERRQGSRSVPRPPDTRYDHVVGCKVQQTKTLGYGRTFFDGPLSILHGGDLGICPTYVMDYVYSSGQAKERFFYAMRPDGTSFGWASWELWDPIKNVMISSSFRNTIVKGSPWKVVNPCGY